jgi:hypothetical protein
MIAKQNTRVFQTKSAEMDTNGVQILRSGQSFGWLRKKTQRLGMSRYIHRFFTVDFDARILYYSRSEFGKKVSMPTPFSDILGVEPLTNKMDEDGQGMYQRRSWKSCSCLPRLRQEEQFDFVIYTKTKHVEVRCTSATGSQKWIATIQAAMLLHTEQSSKTYNDEIDSEQSTRTCSRESSMTNGSEQNSEEHASYEVNEQFLVDPVFDSPLCKVPLSSIAEPGRCLSASSDFSSPVSQVAGLSSPPFPCCIGAGSDTDLLSSSFLSDVSECPPQPITDEAAVDEAQGDLQALLINSVLSSSASTARSCNAWKRPQQPIIQRSQNPSKDSPCSLSADLEEENAGALPTIQEESMPCAGESQAKKAPCQSANLTFRERLLARGKGPLPADIAIP